MRLVAVRTRSPIAEPVRASDANLYLTLTTVSDALPITRCPRPRQNYGRLRDVDAACSSIAVLERTIIG
jgi:hypothetical protein